METIAQTSVQLYNQLRLENRNADELVLVRRAYDLAAILYSGFYQADGVPFTAHVTGVASIIALLGLPTDYVAAACLHNVYTNGDFGDGRERCVTVSRRRAVTDAVGPMVEGHVHRFWTLLRTGENALLQLTEQIDALTPQDRQVMVIDLADTLEKVHELGPLYYGSNEYLIGYLRRDGWNLAGLAERLGHSALAVMLTQAIAALLSERVPQGLRSTDPRQKYGRMTIPNSCVVRPGVVARRKMRRVLRRFRKP